jgi:hypothetical protein
MKSPAKTQPPRRDRSGWISLDLGPLKRTLETIAVADRLPDEHQANVSRTVRRLIREEAQRHGILATNP